MNGPETTSGNGARPDGAVEQERALERQIHTLRGELGELVDELDRRRQEALDVRLQLRRHAPTLIALASVVVFVVAGGFGLAAYGRRRRRDPFVRAQTLRHALAMIARDPERLVRALEGRSPSSTALATALGRVAGTVGQHAVAAGLRRM